MAEDDIPAVAGDSSVQAGIERECRKLGLALGDGVGFRLFMAVWNDRKTRDDCIAQVTAALRPAGVRIGVLDMAEGDSDAGLVSRLGACHRHLTATGPGPVAVMAINFDTAIGAGGGASKAVLETANLQRDRLPSLCPAPVVLWLTPETETDFAHAAPDLWHWRSTTFRFLADRHPAPERRTDVTKFHVDDVYITDIPDIEAELRAIDTLPSAGTPRIEAQRARLQRRLGDGLVLRGDWDRALSLFEAAKQTFEGQGDERERALALGGIADILQARGDLDAALRIRREEQLPVYERLGAVRERAVTMGKIADILKARGDLDAALRILRDEVHPAFERLGDVRSRAVTMGYIADILQARGDLDAALRIRREEQLPVYERLGDVRERAVTMGQIADILEARGDLDAALRIRREEELPVYERLGDVRSLLVGRANLAITLLIRNNLNDRPEANRLLCLALADARRLRLPEAGQIEAFLAQAGFTCD